MLIIFRVNHHKLPQIGSLEHFLMIKVRSIKPYIYMEPDNENEALKGQKCASYRGP